ncbi:hypothetical protein Tco_0163414 [Tanacetum coccineum]
MLLTLSWFLLAASCLAVLGANYSLDGAASSSRSPLTITSYRLCDLFNNGVLLFRGVHTSSDITVGSITEYDLEPLACIVKGDTNEEVEANMIEGSNTRNMSCGVELDSKLLLSLRFMIILPKDGLAYSRPYSYLMDYFVTPPNSGMQRNGNNGVLQDEGPDFKGEKEEAAPEGQQQAVQVVDTTIDGPLGLGYGAARCHALESTKENTSTTFRTGYNTAMQHVLWELRDRVTALEQEMSRREK